MIVASLPHHRPSRRRRPSRQQRRDARFARLTLGWTATALIIILWQTPSDSWTACGLICGLLMGPFHAAWLDHREDRRHRHTAYNSPARHRRVA